MSRASRFIIQPVYNPNPPGSGTTGDYYVVRAPAWQPQVFDFGQTSAALLSTTFTEGVDFPLQPHRWDNQDVIAEDVWAALEKIKAFLSAGISTTGLGSAYALIYTAPPVPDVYAETYPFPFAAYAKKRQVEVFMAGYATATASGAYLPALPATTYSVPVCELLDEIQFHMLEVANFGASMSSGLWTMTEVLNYINLRTYRFLLETGILQQRTTIPNAADNEVVNLPTDLIDIKRVAWTRGATTNELPRTDLNQIDSWIPDWQTVGATDPAVYAQAPEPSLQVQLARVPTQPGDVDLTYVARHPAVTNNCDIFPLPDEWVPFVKYGVLADMWAKEGEANDPERASYCEQRYTEGVGLARLLLGVLDE